ncbi:MAG: hypothetical protein MUE78_06480 [Ilumatobacteraceae bacterium]|jgi:hypothetical protein|nr:hypothetical protein [Ilumatobacteraceae bacterium]
MSPEVVGYVASALVVLSLTMTSVVRLRTISLVGSVTFVVYGALIGSMPIVITNAAIAVINVWFLRTELGMRRDLGASPIPADAPFLVDFVEFHRGEITQFQPDFRMPVRDPFALLLTRDGLPAGAVLGERRGDELHIVLDHVLRPYRDSRLGAWLYGPGVAVFRSSGFRRLVTEPGDATHRAYLERVGFRAADGQYVLEL